VKEDLIERQKKRNQTPLFYFWRDRENIRFISTIRFQIWKWICKNKDREHLIINRICEEMGRLGLW
jgi:hypothetical protein